MGRLAETTGLSAEEVAIALTRLGEDVTVDRVKEIQAIVPWDDRLHQDRDLVVQEAVHRATDTVAKRHAMREAIEGLTGSNARQSYADAGISFGRDGRFTTVEWRDGRRLAYMDERFSREVLVETLRMNMLAVGEGKPYPPTLEVDSAPDGELPYGERILRELVQEHGWSRSSSGGMSAAKRFEHVASGGAKVNVREYVAQFDERGRYLSFEAGWLEVFDIDCRDRDIAGVAMEFDQRASRWAARELTMPTLPRYAREAIGQLATEGASRTATRLDELLVNRASAAGQQLDNETRENAHHESAKLYREYPVFIGQPAHPVGDVTGRDERGRAVEVSYSGQRFEATDLIGRLEAGVISDQERGVLAPVLSAFGIRPGRAFDLAYGRNVTDVDAAAQLREVLDISAMPESSCEVHENQMQGI